MDVDVKRAWLREEREKVGWSPAELGRRAQPLADRAGYAVKFNQQLIWNFENAGKKVPGWFQFAARALAGVDGEADTLPPSPELDGDAADAVMIEMLPTHAGAGGGGTGEGDARSMVFSRTLVELYLRMQPENLLALEISGDSMTPEFHSGDQLLIDRRKTSIAQPGAFCLWDGDGYVIKYLEKVPGSSPPALRVISGNQRYSTHTRLVEEVQIMGRVVWFGRRV